MKKNKLQQKKKTISNLEDKHVVSPEQAIAFLDSFRQLHSDRDEKTQMISLRIPQNLLKTLKLKASVENKKYQSIIVKFIRDGLKAK